MTTAEPILQVPRDVRDAFVRKTTLYVQRYETHDAGVWADSPAEAAGELERVAQAYAAAVLAAELERIARVEDGVIDEMVERRDERMRGLEQAGIDPETDPLYAGLLGVTEARGAVVRKIRERVAELNSVGANTTIDKPAGE